MNPQQQAGSRVVLVHVLADEVGFEITWRPRYDMVAKPPLGLLYLASTLRMNGFLPEVVDTQVEPVTLDGLVDLIRKRSPLFVGFTSNTISAARIHQWIRGIRSALPGQIVVVGGPGACRPVPYLEAGADYVVQGEGEETILLLAEHLRDADDPRGIELPPGTLAIRDGRLADGGKTPRIRDLDALPFPAWNLVPLHRYLDGQVPGMRQPYCTVVTSRGCLFRCTFCTAEGQWGRTYRVRSPLNVVEEVDELVRRHGVRYIGFQDDLFAHDDDWAFELCHRLAALPYRIRWAAMVHPLSFRKNGSGKLAEFRASGCDMLSFGLQSTHPDVLRDAHRSPEEARILEEITPVSVGLGITTKLEYILGLPGEPPGIEQQYLAHAIRCLPNAVKFFRVILLDGTELAELVASGKWTMPDADDIDRRCARSMRRFYLNPRVVANNLRFLVRFQPEWFARNLIHLPFLIEAIGLRAAFHKPDRSGAPDASPDCAPRGSRTA
jgi:radical SAM superfamily enzyme YgiQ (UPF0313 family)